MKIEAADLRLLLNINIEFFQLLTGSVLAGYCLQSRKLNEH